MAETILRQIAAWEAYLARCERDGNVFEADCTLAQIDDLRAELAALFIGH